MIRRKKKQIKSYQRLNFNISKAFNDFFIHAHFFNFE